MEIYYKLSIISTLFCLYGLSIKAQSKTFSDNKSLRGEVCTVNIRKPGELRQRIPKQKYNSIRMLKINGQLSSQDVQFLKFLANRTILKDTLGNRLEAFFDLDLTNATIIEHNGLSKSGASSIPDEFLKGSKLLRRIILPINTESIGNSAFQGCERIKEIKLPLGIKSLGKYCFYGCISLESISLPRTLRTIGSACFERCKKLTIISLPNGLVNIGESAFENSGLVKVQMAETVKSLGKDVFANTQIEYLEIPASLRKFDISAVSGCDNFQNFYVSTDNVNYSDINGILTDKNKTTIIKVPIKKQGICNIPGTITKISDYAFSGCGGIEEIIMPKFLVDIGIGAFSGCNGISSIKLPERINKLQRSSFQNCTNLHSVHLPQNLVIIGENTFAGCKSLQEIKLGKVDSIGASAFADSGLREIDLSKVRYIGEHILSGCSNLKIVKLPPLVEIPSGMFEGSGLTSIILPQGLKIIGASSFKGCRNLQSIGIPQTVTRIKDSALAGAGVQKIVLPDAVTLIDHDAFAGCKFLTSVQLPKYIMSLSSHTFKDCI